MPNRSGVGALRDFLPTSHGLHYANCWASAPVIEIRTPFGTIGIGDAKHGLCGGMAFAVRDLFEAGRTPPGGITNPPSTSAAFSFITRRLLDSFNLPRGVARYYAWMNLPTGDNSFVHGTSTRTIERSMPKLRAAIDAGYPCTLGLVCAHSSDPRRLGQNHHVLAYGYTDDGTTTTVNLYDPNHPDDDNVRITFANSHPQQTTRFAYSYDDREVVGFFVTPYRAADPSALFQTAVVPARSGRWWRRRDDCLRPASRAG
jgi:hypothetical protein